MQEISVESEPHREPTMSESLLMLAQQQLMHSFDRNHGMMHFGKNENLNIVICIATIPDKYLKSLKCKQK